MEKYLLFLLIELLAYSPDYVGNNEGMVNLSEGKNISLEVNNEEENSCLECHKSIIQFSEVHSPAKKECEKCHISNGKEHPIKNVVGFDLKDSLPQLCYSCHDPLNEDEHVHGPVSKGDCTFCHSPHGSPYLYQLKAYPPGKLCVECHELDTEGDKMIHQPVVDFDCTSCHNPHQSDTDKLLQYDVPLLCKRCHKGVKQELKEENVHPPFKKKCLSCHNAHSSKEDHLSDVKIVDICYKCHDPLNEDEIVHDPVAKGKCVNCHSPHSSPNLYLLKADPPGNLCIECHELDTEGDKMIHQPVKDGNCTGCHNPHQSDNDKLLQFNPPLLCKRCHKNMKKELKLEHLHPPFKKDCSTCHEAHSSKEDHLLDQKSLDLCFGCHEELKKEIDNSTLIHQAINTDKNCQNCHSPHASSENKLLLSSQKDICLKCHNRSNLTANKKILNIKQLLNKSKFIHGAIEKDGCSACHDPHVSENSALLNKPFPEEEYVKVGEESFALCFACHNKEMIEIPESKTVTNFRNGVQNLHYFHISGEKGRNCTICHDVHGAMNKFLIAEKVKFGNWEMPIEFTISNNGGSCATGCHSEKKYSR